MHRVIHKKFLEKQARAVADADEKRLCGHGEVPKVIHNFPRENLCILWIIALLFDLLFLNDRADRVRHVDALFAVAFGESLDELMLDETLMVEETGLQNDDEVDGGFAEVCEAY